MCFQVFVDRDEGRFCMFVSWVAEFDVLVDSDED